MIEDIEYIEGFGFPWALVFIDGEYYAECEWGDPDHDYYQFLKTELWVSSQDAVAELADAIADMVGDVTLASH